MKCPYCGLEKFKNYKRSPKYCKCSYCNYFYDKELVGEESKYYIFKYDFKRIRSKEFKLPLVFAEARAMFETGNTKVLGVKAVDEIDIYAKNGNIYEIILRK